jgi:hypothetical protein
MMALHYPLMTNINNAEKPRPGTDSHINHQPIIPHSHQAPTTLKQQARSKRGEAQDATASKAELRPDILHFACTADSDSTSIAVDNGDTAIDSEWKADAAHAKVSYHSNG